MLAPVASILCLCPAPPSLGEFGEGGCPHAVSPEPQPVQPGLGPPGFPWLGVHMYTS